MAPGSELPFEMTGRQRLIYRSISDSEIASLYECALRLLHGQANPSRFVVAAHSIRELMNGLPNIMNVPVLAERGDLGNRVNGLESKWNRAKNGACYKDGKWEGQIDGPLQKLLSGIEEVLQWWQTSRPKRRDVVTELFRQADPAGLPLPKTLEQTRVTGWLALLDYFNGVAHRSQMATVEFPERLDELEQILLDILYREPSVNLSSIDAILAEEQQDA